MCLKIVSNCVSKNRAGIFTPFYLYISFSTQAFYRHSPTLSHTLPHSPIRALSHSSALLALSQHFPNYRLLLYIACSKPPALNRFHRLHHLHSTTLPPLPLYHRFHSTTASTLPPLPLYHRSHSTSTLPAPTLYRPPTHSNSTTSYPTLRPGTMTTITSSDTSAATDTPITTSTSATTTTTTTTTTALLSEQAFEVRLAHLVASGAFNKDHPRRAKGLCQHVKRLLQSWEKERTTRIFWQAPTSISALKWSLKNKRGVHHQRKIDPRGQFPIRHYATWADSSLHIFHSKDYLTQ
ncbi:hypothetical protein L211DRAFT_879921 [Terfezia boudieri ATCC MYA-4762]|uniref:Uncharacterized protein n=1 Tax=Terfezia boudieri ATCC MYA-4762 TaxID=1051890 RepID=A0A3N4LSS5_9PEZI|nr:hypothetical protein L211DRAFT_879921 [Terfezia boudieri ATCC MYA-4762]